MSAVAQEGMARGLAYPAGVKDECQERSLLNPALSSWNTEAPLALSPHTPHPSHLHEGAGWPAIRARIGHIRTGSSIHRAIPQVGFHGPPANPRIQALPIAPITEADRTNGGPEQFSRLGRTVDHLWGSQDQPEGDSEGSEIDPVVLAQSATFAPPIPRTQAKHP